MLVAELRGDAGANLDVWSTVGAELLRYAPFFTFAEDESAGVKKRE